MQALPSDARDVLLQLGQRLRAHRQLHQWTLDEMAERLLCSPATCRALESGKPGTSVGVLAHALWLLGQLDSFASLAPLTSDFAAALTTGRRVRRRAASSQPGVISEHERDF
ncbi:hypothetical protein AwPolaro_08280 [Polaromonas sp.]|nr:hypothetical protein AwPolaro_08280 [Polaromonas sp.]